jgi:CheY-like chemotaxis protein
MGIQGNASLLLLDADQDQPHYEKLKHIEEFVVSGSELTRQLLGLAKGGKYELKPTDLNRLVKKNADMFGRTKKEIEILIKPQKDLWTIEVDQGQIEQVLVNLFVNAGQAMPTGGQLFLETRNVILKEHESKHPSAKTGRFVTLSVTDTGVGMGESTRLKIFDPFFTTKEISRGTGLGLSSAYGIVNNHGGYIDVESKRGEGSKFTIYLPASGKSVFKEHLPEDAIQKGTETILLVDDETMVIDVAKQMLERMGNKVLLARDGQEAVAIFKEQFEGIDLVILDMVMPGMGGSETYDVLKKINPMVKVLLSSGYSIDGQALEIMERGCDGFIQKPFSISKLSKKIREVLES